MDRVLSTDDNILLFQGLTEQAPLAINVTQYLLFNVVIVAVFSYCYVQWLWSAHLTAIASSLVKDFVRKIFLLFFVTLTLWASILIMLFVKGFPHNIVIYGVLLTPMWLATVLFTLWVVE